MRRPAPLATGGGLAYLVFMPRSAASPGVSDVSGAFVHDLAPSAMPMLWTQHRPARPEKSEGGRRLMVANYILDFRMRRTIFR